MKVGALCYGFGGIELGLRAAGVDVDLRWLAENEPALTPVLPPGVPNLGDITAVDWTAVEPVELLTAGFPCQPTSAAGRRLGDDDPRWLWPAVRGTIKALQPGRVLIENVRNLVSYDKGRLWRDILSDLIELDYLARWCTLGACHVGAAHHRHRVFLLAERLDYSTEERYAVERVATTACGAKHGTVLPTPSAVSYGSNQGGAAGRVGPVRHSLDSLAKLDLLPTPTARDGASGPGHAASAEGSANLRHAVTLLPTPQARDGDGRGEGDERYWSARAGHRNNGMPLGAALALLPTPTVGDSRNTRNATAGRSEGQEHHHSGTTLSDVAHGSMWGRFADAVARHEAVYGPAPAPTESNRNGAPRLAPAFAEWLMCMPAGHITDHLPRVPALRAIGNGVCPPQLAAAWHILTGQDLPPTPLVSPLDMSLGRSVASPGMTTAHTADIKEITDMHAEQRRRVIDATMALGLTVDPKLIAAAMTELAEQWRAEAIWISDRKKRGHVATAKELRAAASRLMGFALKLGADAPTAAEDPAGIDYAAVQEAIDAATPDALTLAEQRERCNEGVHPEASLSTLKSGATICTLCQAVLSPPAAAQAVFVSPAPGTPVSSGTLHAPVNDPLEAYFNAPASTKTVYGPGPTTTQVLDGLKAADVQITQTPTATQIVDNPFTSPQAPGAGRNNPVAVVPFVALESLAATLQVTAPRTNTSHSHVDSYANCSLSVLFNQASRYGLIGSGRPSWSQVGGSAFHAAVEAIEYAHLANPDPSLVVVPPIDVDDFWMSHLDVAIKNRIAEITGSPYADPNTWHVANGGREGFDWWRVEGAKMLGLYVKHHDAAWRSQRRVLVLPSQPNAPGRPVLELPYTMTVRSLDGSTGITAEGFIDLAWVDTTTSQVEIIDLKTGRTEPKSTFQLAEYAHALTMEIALDPGNPTPRIAGRYWLARKGIYTDPVDVLAAHPLAELQYRYNQTMRGHQAGIFVPNVTNLCASCGVRDYCPAMSS